MTNTVALRLARWAIEPPRPRTCSKQRPTQAVRQAPRRMRRKAQGNPLAAGVIAFGLGMLVSSSSFQREGAGGGVPVARQPRAGEGESLRSGEDIGEGLKPAAQEAAESVKATAQKGAENVRQEGQSATADVKDQTQASKETVQQQSS